MEVIDSFTGEHRFMSNFHYATVVVAVPSMGRIVDITVPTVEHGYVMMKSSSLEQFLDECRYGLAKIFHIKGDPMALSHDELLRLYKRTTPGQAKRLGRKVHMRKDFDGIKVEGMQCLLYQKFTRHPELMDRLLATGDAVLVEGNVWHDNFWGSCTCAKCASIAHLNMLGTLLMQLRTQATQTRGMSS